MQNTTIITGYSDPDLDTFACAFAYAEYLNKNGKLAKVYLSGKPHREALFVCSNFNITLPVTSEFQDMYVHDKAIPEVILVDASEVKALSNIFTPDQVVEVIDHRIINQGKEFPNAQLQIDLVGAAATLITEKYINTNTKISEQSAILLCSAIISNTINFKANVTTPRDHHAAEWLNKQVVIPENYINEMFQAKTQPDADILSLIREDFATFKFANQLVGIAQLEILNVQEFVDKRSHEIEEALLKYKKECYLDYIFISFIDLEKGNNTFMVLDDKTRNMLEMVLNISFAKNIGIKEGVTMRKTIAPLIERYLLSI